MLEIWGNILVNINTSKQRQQISLKFANSAKKLRNAKIVLLPALAATNLLNPCNKNNKIRTEDLFLSFTVPIFN